MGDAAVVEDDPARRFHELLRGADGGRRVVAKAGFDAVCVLLEKRGVGDALVQRGLHDGSGALVPGLRGPMDRQTGDAAGLRHQLPASGSQRIIDQPEKRSGLGGVSPDN